MKTQKKEAATVAPVTTLNPESNPVDQDKAAGAVPPVPEPPLIGNTPVPPDHAPVDPDAGSDNAVPAATVTTPATSENEMVNGAAAPVIPADAAPASNAITNESAPAAPPVQTTAAQPLNGRVPAATLKAHAENEKLYGAGGSVADLEKSIGKYGILDPLLITKDGRVISGHRRVRVATKLGIVKVPVRVFGSDDELEIKTALLEHNRQRIKSNSQIAAEAKMMQAIEKELATRRKKTGATKNEVETLPPAQKGKSRDATGKKLGISGKSVEKAIKVAGAIETLRADGKEVEATKLEAALEKGFDTGHKAAVEMGVVAKPKPKQGKKKTASTPAENITPPPATVVSASEPSANGPASLDTPPDDTDSDSALEAAALVLTFLRSDAAGKLTLQQDRNWKRIFEQIDGARTDIGL